MAEARYPALFGKYILLERLAAGGMAEVFRAKSSGFDGFAKFLAIKCMLPHLAEDRQFVTMFRDEAHLASMLQHPNIVQISEFERFAGRLYIAMELVEGKDLRQLLRLLKQHGQIMPVPMAVYIVAKAAEGLDFAHRKVGLDGVPLELVHRDVSPQNILVSYTGEIKVVDFGIAKAQARFTETQAGILKGKFAYMAPEQVMGKDVDRRGDIFALGIVLYEVLTGLRLFSADSDMAILEQVRAAKLPNLRSVVPNGAEDLIPIIERALSKDPKNRYQYAAEMADELNPLLINNKTVFGAKLAAGLMGKYFGHEIEIVRQRQQQFIAIQPKDCLSDMGEANIASTNLAGQNMAAAAPNAYQEPSMSSDGNTAQVQATAHMEQQRLRQGGQSQSSTSTPMLSMPTAVGTPSSSAHLLAPLLESRNSKSPSKLAGKPASKAKAQAPQKFSMPDKKAVEVESAAIEPGLAGHLLAQRRAAFRRQTSLLAFGSLLGLIGTILFLWWLQQSGLERSYVVPGPLVQVVIRLNQWVRTTAQEGASQCRQQAWCKALLKHELLQESPPSPLLEPNKEQLPAPGVEESNAKAQGSAIQERNQGSQREGNLRPNSRKWTLPSQHVNDGVGSEEQDNTLGKRPGRY